MKKVIVGIDEHEVSEGVNYYAHIPDMPGLGESGKTKLEAFNELMLSLKVKIAYDNDIDLNGE